MGCGERSDQAGKGGNGEEGKRGKGELRKAKRRRGEKAREKKEEFWPCVSSLLPFTHFAFYPFRPVLCRFLRAGFTRRQLASHKLSAFHDDIKVLAILQDGDVFGGVAIDYE